MVFPAAFLNNNGRISEPSQSRVPYEMCIKAEDSLVEKVRWLHDIDPSSSSDNLLARHRTGRTLETKTDQGGSVHLRKSKRCRSTLIVLAK